MVVSTSTLRTPAQVCETSTWLRAFRSRGMGATSSRPVPFIRLGMPMPVRLIGPGSPWPPTGCLLFFGQRRKRTQALHVSASDCDPMELVEAAIDLTLPSRIGHRNRRLFDFARRLKGIPGFAALDADDLRWTFDRWFARALPNIGTKDVAESWRDFCIAWSNVAFPFGSELRGVLRAAEQSPPASTQRYDGAIHRLACLCARLAANGTGTFFLSCRTAGQLLGVGHTKAAAMLRDLAGDGFIEQVEPHTRRRAVVYRLRIGVGDE